MRIKSNLKSKSFCEAQDSCEIKNIFEKFLSIKIMFSEDQADKEAFVLRVLNKSMNLPPDWSKEIGLLSATIFKRSEQVRHKSRLYCFYVLHL